MTNRPSRPGLRRAVRALALTPALVLLGTAGTAAADAPDTWQTGPSVSGLHVILLLGGVPLALFVLITLLVYLPSMRHGDGHRPGEAWHGQSEWFGGPRGGLEAADRTTRHAVTAASGPRAEGVRAEQDTQVGPGGTSGRW